MAFIPETEKSANRWSSGYDSNARAALMGYPLNFSGGSRVFCRTVVKQGINYAILSTGFRDIHTNYDFYEKYFPEVYKNDEAHFKIFDLKKCSGS